MIVEFNGQVVPKREWTPFVHRIVRRVKSAERVKRRRLRASGVLVGAANNAAFVPVLRIYTTGTSATDTTPDKAQNVAVECWGSGGGGGGGVTVHVGGGGGAGGFCKSTYATSANKTLTYTVGALALGGGAQTGGGAGNPSSVSSGTLSITTMTGNGGNPGSGGTAGGSGSPGTGGTGVGGNVTNTTGASGVGSSAGGGTAGSISGDGSPYGGGGAGGDTGQNSHVGAVVFSYS